MATPEVDLFHQSYDIKKATCREGLDLEETLLVEPQEFISRRDVYRRHKTYGPKNSMFRNNLAALSQFYNLYFVAQDEDIYVYVPSSRNVPALPVMIIKPEVENPLARGHIMVHRPRVINSLIIGELKDDEIVLTADDGGNVTGYRTRDIFEWAQRSQKRAEIHARVDVQPPIKPFFKEWVHMSAWGLAVHKAANLIAVSSNTRNITVFAFAQRSESSERSGSYDSNGESYNEGEDDWDFILYEPQLQNVTSPEACKEGRRRNIRLILHHHDTNIPSVSFFNSDSDPEGNWLISIDVDNNLYLWRIWESVTPVRRFAFQNQAIDDYQHLTPVHLHDQMGWCILALDHRNFRPQKSLRHACGGQPRRLPPRNNVATYDMSALAYIRRQGERVDDSLDSDSMCEPLDLDFSNPLSSDDSSSVPLPPAVQPTPHVYDRNLDFIGKVQEVKYIPTNNADPNAGFSSKFEEKVKLLTPDEPYDQGAIGSSLPWFFANETEFVDNSLDDSFTIPADWYTPNEEEPPDITPGYVRRWLTSASGSENSSHRDGTEESNPRSTPLHQDNDQSDNQEIATGSISPISDATGLFPGVFPEEGLEEYGTPVLHMDSDEMDVTTDTEDDDLSVERVSDAADEQIHETENEEEWFAEERDDFLSLSESGSDDSEQDSLGETYDDIRSTFSILHTSEKDVRLISSPSSSKPSLIFREVFSSMKEQRCRIVLYNPCIKFVQQIPELGVVVIATSTHFAMIFSMTDVEGSERKYLRAEAQVPFESQYNIHKRPSVPLVGLSVGPVPCHLFPSKPITPQPHDIEAIKNLQNDKHSFDEETMQPATNITSSTSEAWRNYEPTRRYRLFLLYQDNEVFSYQLSLIPNAKGTSGPRLEVVK